MLTRQLRRLLIALRTHSRLPLPGPAKAWAGDDPAERARAAAWLPAVGLAVALPATFVYAFCGLWLPHAIAVLAAMLAMLLLAGAVHERALAHWVDDGRQASAGVGAPGAIALSLLMLARLELLSTIDPTWLALTLVCAAAFSRGCAVLVCATLPAGGAFAAPTAPTLPADATPTVTHDGDARPADAANDAPDDGARHPRAARAVDALWALAWGIAPAAGAAAWTQDPPIFVTAGALALLASAWMRRLARRRTAARGHALGAVQAVAEIAFLVGVLATLSVAGGDPDETLS